MFYFIVINRIKRIEMAKNDVDCFRSNIWSSSTYEYIE